MQVLDRHVLDHSRMEEDDEGRVEKEEVSGTWVGRDNIPMVGTWVGRDMVDIPHSYQTDLLSSSYKHYLLYLPVFDISPGTLSRSFENMHYLPITWNIME